MEKDVPLVQDIEEREKTAFGENMNVLNWTEINVDKHQDLYFIFSDQGPRIQMFWTEINVDL